MQTIIAEVKAKIYTSVMAIKKFYFGPCGCPVYDNFNLNSCYNFVVTDIYRKS